MTTYANSYHKTTRGEEGAIALALYVLADALRARTITSTEAIEAARAVGAFETEIAQALGV